MGINEITSKSQKQHRQQAAKASPLEVVNVAKQLNYSGDRSPEAQVWIDDALTRFEASLRASMGTSLTPEEAFVPG